MFAQALRAQLDPSNMGQLAAEPVDRRTANPTHGRQGLMSHERLTD